MTRHRNTSFEGWACIFYPIRQQAMKKVGDYSAEDIGEDLDRIFAELECAAFE